MASSYRTTASRASTSNAASFDLDFFKKVNDDHGHSCGDYVLKATCGLAKACLRKDDIIGRLGGEEFVVVLPA